MRSCLRTFQEKNFAPTPLRPCLNGPLDPLGSGTISRTLSFQSRPPSRGALANMSPSDFYLVCVFGKLYQHKQPRKCWYTCQRGGEHRRKCMELSEGLAARWAQHSPQKIRRGSICRHVHDFLIRCHRQPNLPEYRNNIEKEVLKF